MAEKEINPCKCGSDKKPHMDSDLMVSSWGIECFDCQQFVFTDWTTNGLIDKWNNLNPIINNENRL